MQMDDTHSSEPERSDLNAEEEFAPEGAGSEVSAEAASADAVELALADLTNKFVRLQADFENYRKRTARARADAADDARRELFAALLPVYDNFLRALDHAEENPESRPFVEGFELIAQQFSQFLQQQGLQEIAAAPGMAFDPKFHEATGTLPAPGANSSGAIADELQKGFTFGGIVVRPAKVLVYQ
jgi:molecular chaperone GrpE